MLSLPGQSIASTHSKVDRVVKPQVASMPSLSGQAIASTHSKVGYVHQPPVSTPSEPSNNHLYVAGVPVHAKPKCSCSEMCNSDGEPNDNNNEQLCFGIFIQTLLEGCQEEGHHNDAIDFIHSFTNKRRCPSNHRCLNYIFNILMTNADNTALLVNAFKTLKHVQHLHPGSKYVEWKTFITIMKVLFEDGASSETNQESTCSSSLIKLHGNFLALKYITSILEEDLETQNEGGQVNRSYVYNMLSPDIHFGNVRTVIGWISKCVERIHKEEQVQCNNASPPPREEKQQNCRKKLFFSTQSVQEPPQSKLTILFMVLELLQKLLYMCMVASANLDQSASKVADEFLYFYSRLPSFEHKRRLLQTITCHQLRIKLIELILNDNYEVDHDTIDRRTLSLSVSKIVEYYFKCLPPKALDGDDDDDDDSDDEDDECKVKESTKDPAHECEELVMLLLYLMQSYIWSSNGKLPDTDRTLRFRSANESHPRSSSHMANQLMPFNGKFTMSLNDREPLIMMGTMWKT
ncbi:SUMO-interacting motif-containing protein 1-like [Amphiura filiformis]|uniref:SUMO-interacting motif-containing protein 1-like n=1 Tax=Amphiura filiformis TaxID=82378 RepID=UPI003B2135E8